MALHTLIFAFFFLAAVYKIVSTLVRKKLLATLTAVNDLPLLGTPRKDKEKISGTAVICGGSIAGLLSARVCSDHFKNVVMVEPEDCVTKAEVRGNDKSFPVLQNRSRVLQYTTFHGYQSFMTLALRRLFINYDLEVAKVGARFIAEDGNVHWSGLPIHAPRHKYTPTSFPVVPNLTRAGFETILRRLVLSTCPNVRYISGTVTGLVKSESSDHVVHSVTIRSRNAEESSLRASLVVDCTGPSRGGFRWLQSLSSTSITDADKSSSSLQALKLTYDPKMAYSTCTFDVPSKLIPSLNALGLPEDFETAGFMFANVPDSRIESRHLLIGRKENNALQIVCGGWGVRDRMTSAGEIKNYLSQIKVSRPLPEWISRMVSILDEERVPATFVHARCPPSVYVQYYLADNIPSNFIAIGDSVLKVNPVRGQGTGKACVEAVTLNAMLTRCAPTNAASASTSEGTGGSLLPKDFSRTFFNLQRKRTGTLWETYKSEDYAWKTTDPAEGEDLERTGAWRRAYGDAILRLMLKDREVSSVSWHVGTWVAPSTDLLSPTIILKLLWMQVQDYVGL